MLCSNEKCKLALQNLPDVVYDTEWDLVMIDASRGYFAKASRRMAVIFLVAVMARDKKDSGMRHVFLHEVDRRVEKIYAEEFLCRKNLVKAEKGIEGLCFNDPTLVVECIKVVCDNEVFLNLPLSLLGSRAGKMG
ncbi:hypothetical protein RJT34_31061 [Clitoria ternatea]|uniref:Polysaccharide biosynthesis domain-containing protein n=1 Tax=Clitoria ternatea TaxID=43366 RepID=A0AAN9I4N1_CLITE